MIHHTKPLLGTQLNWAHPLNKGLVGFWLFNEGNGNKVQDLSMNGNTGTLLNMDSPPTAASGWNPGRKGIGLNFDGSNDYVDAGNGASLDSTNITVSAWVKYNTANSYYQIVGKYLSSTKTGYKLAVEQTTGKAYFAIGTGTTTPAVLTLSSLNDNIWHFIVGVSNGTNASIYVDGGIPQSVAGNLISPSAGSEIIGRDTVGNTGFFNGSIDEVRVYNRALTAQEVMQSYIEPYSMFK